MEQNKKSYFLPQKVHGVPKNFLLEIKRDICLDLILFERGPLCFFWFLSGTFFRTPCGCLGILWQKHSTPVLFLAMFIFNFEGGPLVHRRDTQKKGIWFRSELTHRFNQIESFLFLSMLLQLKKGRLNSLLVVMQFYLHEGGDYWIKWSFWLGRYIWTASAPLPLEKLSSLRCASLSAPPRKDRWRHPPRDRSTIPPCNAMMVNHFCLLYINGDDDYDDLVKHCSCHCQSLASEIVQWTGLWDQLCETTPGSRHLFSFQYYSKEMPG